MEVNQQDDTIHASIKISKHAPSSMSTSDTENRCKQLEAEIEPLMQTLEEFKSNKRYNGNVDTAIEELLEDIDAKWSLHEQVQNLFTVALKLSYPEFKDIHESDVLYYIRYYGEFFCEDVLNIWPRLRGEGKAHLGPRRVAREIKKNVQLLQQQSGIIGLPWVMDIGFVAFILSGKWMAKGLHKLLRDGVDTWAPLLFTKNCLVNIYFPTTDLLSDMDLLPRELLKQTLINILEYCKVDWCSMPPSCGMDDDLLPQEEFDKFRTTIHDEDVLVFAQGQDEPLIRAKRGSCDPLIDLKNLWYGLEKKRADWLVCLAPVQQQEYIQMCFSAAQHAKWLPSDRDDLPSASYAVYQSCNASMEDLVAKAKKEDLHSLLAKVEPIVSKAEYTIEEFFKCAVKYSFLSNHRLDVCEFSFQQMFYTFEYLLNTQVRNRSFTKEHREDIDELKRASELTLGEDEIWDEGNERVLVLHLLEFTPVITFSCFPVLPNKLCEYVYALSRRFNSYCDSWEVGIPIDETKLLLCKETEVVMDKCFQLLGIAAGDKHKSLGFLESLLQAKQGLPKSVLQAKQGLPISRLQVGRLNHRDPPKKPKSRFQLFSVYIHIRDPTVEECMLFGKITISDTSYGVQYRGWGDDGGTVNLFRCNIHEQIRVANHGELDLGSPSSIHFPSFSSNQVVPLSSYMEISVQLYASTLNEAALFPLARSCVEMDFANFWKLDLDTKCDDLLFESDDGDVHMYYALLRDAVDCIINVAYRFNEDRKVDAHIYAFMVVTSLVKNEDLAAKNYYTASLYDGLLAGKAGRVPLQRSMMVVPAKGSIVIKARLHDDSKKHLDEDLEFMFHAQPAGDVCIKKMGSCGGCCSLRVSVVWRH